ncbi:MAG: bifunctional tRNA (5-methylaminomethyl-2-thiouridine)(34)-methyltransferase MnmD/FAD-dependent 5-carboxymethylaminomethyl-2-thiouridine(34) oxidoreductase MnmC [Pseudomonadota bacterium]|nr:bifunctional tRNA (5-methylaminomethyl-2-thiouridine)(34)-methyltransferase MnmD/FAD-dependent 5-carboxymethylaminomethyl-2-thiouridine(34) oxidoreductase MnmC [Pseudomonadota bacterium]
MIRHAKIEFNESGTPVAQDFDDVYFSNDNGLLESDYVFFQQNNIASRWQHHPRRHFVIAETGFGTGLNFLNTWQRFNQDSDKSVEQLHFISFEKFPLEQSALQQALAAWPELTSLSEQLVASYPTAIAGCHRLEFDQGRVILDLWFGDIQDTLPQLCYGENGIVDAWYLDGFAPSKNPDMWQQSLFDGMANLGRSDCTFATFTAAGFVRRGFADAGFSVKKVKGYGRKREMVVGTLEKANQSSTQPAYFERSTQSLEKVAIIGGGIATATLAYSFAKRGIACDIFCKDDALAKGASHNHQGAVYPNLQADFNAISEFFAHSFYYAKRVYQQIHDDGYHYPHDWCGVLLHGISDSKVEIQQRVIEKNAWPSSLIRGVSAQQANDIAGFEANFSGLFISEAGWVKPPALVNAIFAASNSNTSHNIVFNTEISDIVKTQNGYQLIDSNNQDVGEFSQVFITCGELTTRFSQTQVLPFSPVRGQVTRVMANDLSQKLKTVLCHKGYFTPQLDNTHCMGATFEKRSMSREISSSDNLINLNQLRSFYPEQLGITEESILDAKAAIRCTTPDHQPIVGEVPDEDTLLTNFAPLRNGKHYNFATHPNPNNGLYVFSGLGARGLCTAPLAAEMLVAALCDEPLPVPTHISEMLHPNRFIVRDLKRNKR